MLFSIIQRLSGTGVTFRRLNFIVSNRHETPEQPLHSLRELAQYCQFGTLESTLIRDIFTAHILDFEIQKDTIRGFYPKPVGLRNPKEIHSYRTDDYIVDSVTIQANVFRMPTRQEIDDKILEAALTLAQPKTYK